MKYVDEFRDPAKARALLREIEALVGEIETCRRRPLQLMEVCGGHTHSIFRYGLETMLPAEIEFVHGPGCPVCVLPMGRVDDCVALAEHPSVIFTTFGDAMRVPGSKKSLLQAKADGADVRMVYSPMDALAIAKANPDKEVVFFGLGFETTMPSTALTVLEAERKGIKNFSLFCNHITIIPTIKAIFDSPELTLDGFVGPGHVSMVIGTAPYDFIARHYKKPLVVAGFEPLDILQSVWMLLKQIADGRCEVENQYQRVVARGGQQPGAGGGRKSIRAARVLRVAGPGLDRPFGRAHPHGLCRLRCRAPVLGAQPQDRRSQVLPVRRGPEGRDQALAVQGVRHRLHAGDAARRAHGVLGRRLRGLLQLWRRAACAAAARTLRT